MNLKILVDVNVLLDVLLRRQPHFEASEAIWTAVEHHKIDGWVSADSFSTLYYLSHRALNHAEAYHGIQMVHKVFATAPLDAAVIGEALRLTVDDFEDAVKYACALQLNVTAIVTRDERHFQHATIPVMTPRAFLAKFNLA